MKLRIGIQVPLIAVLLLSRGYGEDALTVIDLEAPTGQMVESAPIQVPAGYSIGFSLYHSNDEVANVANQGIKLRYSDKTFTIIEVPSSSRLTYTNLFTNTILVPTVAWGGLGQIIGPATFSAFASNATVRAVLYVQPTGVQSHFLNGPDDKREVVVPANAVMRYSVSGGLLPCKVTATTPTGWIFFSQPRSPWKPYSVGNSTYSNETRYSTLETASGTVGGQGLASSSVAFPNFSYSRNFNWISPNQSGTTLVGPAIVTFSTMSNSLSGAYFGAFSYDIFPANVSYQSGDIGGTNSNGSTNTNAPATRSFALQLQRSTNLTDWTVTDNYYINETSDKVFYRLEPVAQ
jgi:hypothetical protein